MKQISITKFMIEEHGKLLSMLMILKKEKYEKAFQVLNSSLQRHVLAEEKVIIMLQSRGEIFTEMTLILKQHEEIEKLMKKIGDHLQRNLDDFEKDLKSLLELMKQHIQLENEKFYPKLDKELDERERKVIFEKLHDAIIGNIMA